MQVNVIQRYWVPYGTIPYEIEKFPKHARRAPRHEDKAIAAGANISFTTSDEGGGP